MTMNIRTLTITLLTAAIGGIVSCSSRGGNDNRSDIRNSSLPKEVKAVVMAAADRDSSALISQFDYPLQRPYPLHDIGDEEMMRDYYHTLVDDSLLNVLSTSSVSEWQDFGWRGWTVSDGRYLWIDGGIYDLTYMSGREKRLYDKLVYDDLATLPPALSRGWTPEGCWTSEDDDEVYRLDSQKGANGVRYRLMVYPDRQQLHGQPDKIYYGHLELEGSAMVQTYYFDGPDGVRLVFMPESADAGMPATLTYEDEKGGMTDVAVLPAYWLDLMK